MRKVQKRNVTPYITLTLIFLLGFYVRLEPYLYEPNIPYGLGDAAFHYQVGKTLYEGKSLDYLWNGLGSNLRHDRFYYPPLSYYLMAFSARLTGDFQHIVYVVNALFSSLAILTTYLLIRELLGEYPALASSLFIALSIRDISSLHWGQWHTAYSLAFVPLILYFGIKSMEKNTYLYLFAFSTGLCILTYPPTAVFPLASFILFAFFQTKGKLPWSLRQLLLSLTILLITVSPMYSSWGQLVNHTVSEGGVDWNQLGLTSWYPPEMKGIPVYPKEWYAPIFVYTLPGLVLILIGVVILLLKCKAKAAHIPLRLSAVMVAVFYILLHSTLHFSHMRALKVVTLEPYVLLIAFSVPLSTKLVKGRGIKAAYLLLLAILVLTQLPPLCNVGENLFPVGVRLTPMQMEALNWLKTNTGGRSLVAYFGYNDFMLSWGTVLSDRMLLRPLNGTYYIEKEPVKLTGEVYALLDSNMPFIQPQRRAERLREVRAVNDKLSENSVPVFTNDEIIIRRINTNLSSLK
ncbi:MAG: glycosyltransferase family 39 protein [Candidatus Altiarchaeota archaeon]